MLYLHLHQIIIYYHLQEHTSLYKYLIHYLFHQQQDLIQLYHLHQLLYFKILYCTSISYHYSQSQKLDVCTTSYNLPREHYIMTNSNNHQMYRNLTIHCSQNLILHNLRKLKNCYNCWKVDCCRSCYNLMCLMNPRVMLEKQVFD